LGTHATEIPLPTCKKKTQFCKDVLHMHLFYCEQCSIWIPSSSHTLSGNSFKAHKNLSINLLSTLNSRFSLTQGQAGLKYPPFWNMRNQGVHHALNLHKLHCRLWAWTLPNHIQACRHSRLTTIYQSIRRIIYSDASLYDEHIISCLELTSSPDQSWWLAMELPTKNRAITFQTISLTPWRWYVK
jgi:hypothetical protein